MPGSELDQSTLPGHPDPCGCTEDVMAKQPSTRNSNEIPSLEDLESLLDEVEQETIAQDADLELEEAEMDLDAEEEELLPFEEEGTGSLDQLLAIASRHPGLKITLSF